MRHIGNTYWMSVLLENLAHVRLQLADWRAAASLLEEALYLSQDYENSLNLALYVSAMSQVALLRGRPEQATLLLGSTDSFLKSLGVDFEPPDRAAFEQNLETARARLGPRFEAVMNEGRCWTIKQSASVALELGRVPSTADSE